ncbi:MAG: amino-acid N-acetyltransferase [Pseudomonadales bacterium]|nr:amino-acid N-acetyltransferase [Pseudomonadales bacterium]
MAANDYARWFRGSTPYISAHRNKTFVILLTSEVLEHVNLTNIIHDLALLHVLGVKLVLVHGARAQIEQRLGGKASKFHNDRRITDADAIATIAEINGGIRTTLEALFSTGLPNSPLHNVDIPVISGNFVIAQPVGIVDGIDHLFTGEVRKVEKARVRTTLDAGGLLVQSPIGFSNSGQAFNLSAEILAAEIAIQIKADKLIVLDDFIVTNKADERVSTFTPTTLEQVKLDHSTERGRRLAAMSQAVRGGVSKSHLINFEDDGALLAELFTADGIGTQVLERAPQPIRRANVQDVAGIIEVIRPLEERGILVRRERDRLEQEIENFLVAELDGIIVGCCAIYPYDDHGELACVAVHENYRAQTAQTTGGNGIGKSLLIAAEAQAVQNGLTQLFVLTTQTQEWFKEQGFEPASIDTLPESKQSLYNWQRNSAVLTKPIS